MMADQKNNGEPMTVVKTIARRMIEGVYDDLVKQEVINPKEINNMKKQFSSVINNNEDLVKTVTQKGVQICQIFRSRLSIAGRQLQSEIQAEDENLETMENAGMSQVAALLLSEPQVMKAAESLNKLKLSPTDFYHNLKKAKEDEIYPIKTKGTRTRLALIISNSKFHHLSELNNAQADVQRMTELLQELGYSVDVKENLTSLEMESVLNEFADHPEHLCSDSTFIVFMSHCTCDGICGIKHQQQAPDVLATDIIFQIFNNSNCDSMINKPKIIIIHGCKVEQGAMTSYADSFVQFSKADKEKFWKDAVKEHVEKDFICFHSTIPYDITLEGEQKGSHFINLLIDCFQQYSWCCHVEEVFKKVQKLFETSQGPIQRPIIERQSMTRYFYLFPGI